MKEKPSQRYWRGYGRSGDTLGSQTIVAQRKMKSPNQPLTRPHIEDEFDYRSMLSPEAHAELEKRGW